jgi:hypothetical protein
MPARSRALLLSSLALAVGGLSACGGDDATATTTTQPASASQNGVVQPEPALGAGLVVSMTSPCDLATLADVRAATGGDVVEGEAADRGSCSFQISGDSSLGPIGIVPVTLTVTLIDDGYLTVDELSETMPDIEAIPGLGDEAWYLAFGHELHVNVGGTDLVVTGFAPPAGSTDTAMQAVLVRLASTALGHIAASAA